MQDHWIKKVGMQEKKRPFDRPLILERLFFLKQKIGIAQFTRGR
jgi:hypothetical protein